MNNKVLVKVYVPEMGEKYDVFIPVNEYIYVVTDLIRKSIISITGIDDLSRNSYLMNRDTLQIYPGDFLVRDTDIKNSIELLLL